MEPIINDMYNPPVETQERINNLIRNGVFKDIQEFTNKAVEKFLTDFDHSKINPFEEQKSILKFRVHTESFEELEAFLYSEGYNGIYTVKLVDYCKLHDGDILMWCKREGVLSGVFEVDLFENCPNLKDGEEYTRC
jgi:hypothetical protein